MKKSQTIYLFILALIVSAGCTQTGHYQCVPIHHPINFSAPSGKATIMLFDGTGASACDVLALENILDTMHLDYSTISSQQLNGLTQAQLKQYDLLIMPGGNFIDMGKSLTPAAATTVQAAVQHGLNYLGIRAGGFLAGKSGYYNGLNLTSGATFSFYRDVQKNIHKAVVPVTLADGTTLDQYWEDGPQLTGWGVVVGRYPDATPAIVEGACGNGWVLLDGIHAEAPENWRLGMTFTTPAAADNAYVAKLIRAALNKTTLPHF